MDHGHGNDFYWQEGARRGHDDWWGWPLHTLFFLLLIALLVVGVIWLARRLSPTVAAQAAVATMVPATESSLPTPAPDPAVAALRMRYARGEVSREDFRQALEDLTGAAAPTPPGPWPGDDPGEAAPTA